MGNARTRSTKQLRKDVTKEMKFYLLDYGKDMLDEGQRMIDHLDASNYHYIAYLTNADGLLCLEEVDEDEFLNHFKNTKQNA